MFQAVTATEANAFQMQVDLPYEPVTGLRDCHLCIDRRIGTVVAVVAAAHIPARSTVVAGSADQGSGSACHHTVHLDHTQSSGHRYSSVAGCSHSHRVHTAAATVDHAD